MGEQGQGKKKTGKRTRPQKYARQYSKTATNTRRRRAVHAKAHPADGIARLLWDKHPIRIKKGE